MKKDQKKSAVLLGGFEKTPNNKLCVGKRERERERKREEKRNKKKEIFL